MTMDTTNLTLKLTLLLPLLILIQICLISFNPSYGPGSIVSCRKASAKNSRWNPKLPRHRTGGGGGGGDEPDDLSALFVIHRHGDRSPNSFGPKDPNKDVAQSVWPMGRGQLDKAGRRRMFKLGEFIRKRYARYLSTDPREVHASSSDVDRCIESAQLVLAGLYKPVNHWTWHSSLNWQPLAVHTVPQVDDPMLNLFSNCPVREKERDVYLKANISIIKDEQDIAGKLMESYGYTSWKPVHYLNMFITLELEKEANLKLYPWLVDDSYRLFNRLGDMAREAMGLYTQTEQLKKLSSGALIKDIIDKMALVIQELQTQVASGRSKAKKLYQYSTHDTNINALLDTLGLIDDGTINEMPKFGSTIFIELRRRGAGKFIVKMYFLNNTQDEDKDMREILLRRCTKHKGEECTFDKFDQFTKMYQLTLDQWRRECVDG